MSPTTLVTETGDGVAVITLNRPEVLNALDAVLLSELADVLSGYDEDREIRAIVLTGSEKAFAAGADITEMVDRDAVDMYLTDHLTRVADTIARIRTPIVAAVAGYALGGGCELAMMCDIIIAAESARFGQPEIKLGVLPGIGGTQRLPRYVGKAKAMDLCLTGRLMDAAEAERAGLVSRVVKNERLVEEARAVAAQIAGMSLPALYLVKEAIGRAYETTLAQGCHFERRLFHASFALEDQKEGMRAFLEKRPPVWRHR